MMDSFLRWGALGAIVAQTLISLFSHENYAARDSAALVAIAMAALAIAWKPK